MKASFILKTIAMACILTSSVFAADMSPAQKQQVEGVVHDYLIKNPNVVVESLQIYQQKQMAEARKTVEKTQEYAPKYATDLFHAASDPIVGNPNGKITVVEFFDYQCPHCVEMTPVLEALIKSNPEVRVIFKEFPIRGPASEMASKAALAAKIQGKYFEFHKALMASNKVLTMDDILKIAQNLNLDVNKLKADMNSDMVNQQIKSNYQLAQSLKLMGTPAFFIAKSSVSNNAGANSVGFIPGQVDQAQLESVIKKINQS